MTALGCSLTALGCSEAPTRNPTNPNGPVGGSANTAGTQGTGATPMIGIGNTGSGGKSGGGVEECATSTSMAEPAPLDIYVMLDISGSMLEMTAGGQQKWAAVKSAIGAFLSDPGSAGINVGIQYFPLRKPDVPATCTTNAECGSGGSCFLKRCQSYPVPGGVAQCDTDDDCKSIPAAIDFGPCMGTTCRSDATKACTKDADCLTPETRDFGPCVEFGVCENDRSLTCPAIGQSCGDTLGMCVAPESSFCFHGTQCDSSAYATPAVPIAPVAEAGPMIVASMDAQVPDGDTPSAPALRGAIEHARARAMSNPGHSVVAVLATDGAPTECLPDTQRFTETVHPRELVNEVASVAYEGSVGTPSIPTFVIGVFSASDTAAPENLNIIADAGGTQTAQIVDTSGDISFQFLRALNAIRKSRLACEYQIPAPEEGETLNYRAVNIDLVEGDTREELYYVTSADRCDAEGGWYYDDPTGKAPTKILVCPSTCERFQNAGAGAVQIKLGCVTRIR